jgi:hypothetical protein
MVLVFIANANSSNEIKKELAIASQNNLVVIPVRIEDVIPNEAFAYEFATRQWIDLFEDWESSIARLVELIATTSGDQPSGDQSTGDAAVPPAGKALKTDPPPATGPASFMQQPVSRWAMMAGVALIIAAITAYEVGRQSHHQIASDNSVTPMQAEQAANVASPAPSPPAAPPPKQPSFVTLGAPLSVAPPQACMPIVGKWHFSGLPSRNLVQSGRDSDWFPIKLRDLDLLEWEIRRVIRQRQAMGA